METLYDDMISFQLVDYLSLKDIIALFQTNKRFASFGKKDIIWKHLVTLHFDIDVSLKNAKETFFTLAKANELSGILISDIIKLSLEEEEEEEVDPKEVIEILMVKYGYEKYKNKLILTNLNPHDFFAEIMRVSRYHPISETKRGWQFPLSFLTKNEINSNRKNFKVISEARPDLFDISFTHGLVSPPRLIKQIYDNYHGKGGFRKAFIAFDYRPNRRELGPRLPIKHTKVDYLTIFDNYTSSLQRFVPILF